MKYLHYLSAVSGFIFQSYRCKNIVENLNQSSFEKESLIQIESQLNKAIKPETALSTL